jgi:predicted transcriptional regulator
MQASHESELTAKLSSSHVKFNTLLAKAESGRNEALGHLAEARRTLETTKNELDERIRKDFEMEEERKVELGLLQQQVNELQKPIDLEIAAAEERGKQMGLVEKEAHWRVLQERLSVRCLLPRCPKLMLTT